MDDARPGIKAQGRPAGATCYGKVTKWYVIESYHITIQAYTEAKQRPGSPGPLSYRSGRVTVSAPTLRHSASEGGVGSLNCRAASSILRTVVGVLNPPVL